MEEIWKPIKGYEGLYEVSNLGRVKSLKRWHHPRENILKNKFTTDGYYETALLKNGKYKYIRTHRIVAQTFIPNEMNKKEVNHKDGNKLNNCVDNLEWVTSSENQKHAYKLGLQTVSGAAIINRKRIRCIDLNIEKESLSEMQLYLYENGYTNSKRLNRLSEIINKDINVYLGMRFELCK